MHSNNTTVNSTFCLTLAKAKSAISLGASALIVIASIIVVGFGVYFNASFNTTNTTSQIALNSNGTSSIITSPTITTTQTVSNSNGLRLDLSVASNGSSESIEISVDEYNTLSTVNNVNSANTWTTNQSSLYDPCPDSWPPNNPVNFAMFQGNYGSNNYTNAKALLLQSPNIQVSCTIQIGNQTSHSFSFFPQSDHASIIFANPSAQSNFVIAASVSADGFWSLSNGTAPATSHNFAQGIYTVVATDEWGKAVLVHVTFSNTGSIKTATSTSVATTSSSPLNTTTDVIVSSDVINSSYNCGKDLVGTTAMNTLESNIENSSTFVSLEQNRTYQFGGVGCSPLNGTQLKVVFSYTDLAHPFPWCPNSVSYPYYIIYAQIYLVPSGYDISRTSYSTVYYDSGNYTQDCTTSTAG